MNSLATFIDRLTYAISIRERELGTPILKKDLAAAADVSSSAVTLWYKGKTEELKAASLFGLAKYLKVRPEWLWNKVGQMRDGELKRESAAAPIPKLSAAAQKAVDAITAADKNGLPTNVLSAIAALVNAIPPAPNHDADGERPHLHK
ncbi:hypothetical protein WJ60_09920 [Burkholderia ubonensis]|uniref:helix-turn-helix domain-containing protein n=1 Tax=Burkholderia ubonensis TaxID=101571 RepID=UPI000758D6D3|nr:helix-turn-helix domain-containing protein [Burkholderia ubonensis]KVM70142.1 hypothetical protein WJ60_09920 [Burkholderia ubonensis]